jgi:hypothetical protein
MGTNLRSTARTRHSPMQAYDSLPPELRAWLAQAALPWSVASVRKLWAQERARRRCAASALARLSQLEARALQREAPDIWGPRYPASEL